MFVKRCVQSCKTFIPKQRLLYSIHRLQTQRPSVGNFSSASVGNKNAGNKNFRNLIIAGLSVSAGVSAYFYLSKRNERKIISDEDDIQDGDDYIDEILGGENLEEALDFLQKQSPLPYLIIGGGTSALAAFRAIRAKDETSKVVVIGEEPFYPYMRPPLSKEMWFEEKLDASKNLVFTQWNGKERSIFFERDEFYNSVTELFENKNGGVSVLRGIKVTRIDPTNQTVHLGNDKSLGYRKCLLATGGKPKNLEVFETADTGIQKQVTLFRNVQDFRRLHRIMKKTNSVTIIGGGFLGSELACALGNQSKKSKLKVIQIFPEDANMGKVLPDYLSEWTMKKISDQGVQVMPKTTIKSITKKGKNLELQLSNGETVSTEHVIVAVGLSPSTELASVSGLEVDDKHGGFLVNAELEARKNLWVAGDACCFYDVKLGRRRVEHHDHAVVSGRLAGENMAGSGKPYWHQSMFWSDLGPEIGYEAIGIIDSSLETVGVFAKATEKDTPKAAVEVTDEGIRSEAEKAPSTELQFETPVPRPPKQGDNFGKGVIFYLRDTIIVGIVLWNVFAKMPIARKIINDAKPNQDLAEIAKLFTLKEDSE